MTSETCLDETTATQLLLGTLPAEIAEAKEQHLLDCPSCLEKAQSISAEDELVASLRVPATADKPEVAETKQAEIRSLVEELEKLGGTAQIAASAREEIRTILGQPHSDDELGRLLHFRILEVLGAGGMGIVFKAEDGQLNRIVALKAMRPSLAIDPEAKLRFRREAMAVAAFEHDHVVTVYQVEEDNGIPFFSMQWLEGESLKERLRREGKLSTDEALRITREISLGLIAAHERGLLHRDVKPDNVWLQSPDGRVKILDFGLVRSIEERSSLTHSGTILGTPEYMAPEQACGEAVDERCDLFSVGCVLYHMLTGQPPFQAKNVVATLVAISNANVTAPHIVDAEIPLAVSDLAVDLLKRDPKERVASAHDLADRIEQLEQRPETQQQRESTNGTSWLWRWLAAAAAVIVAGVIALQMNHGTLNIDADESVVATIEGDAVHLLDKATKKQYKLSIGKNKLRPGDYEIVAREEASGLEFTARDFTIRRGGEKDLRVWLSPPQSAESGSAQRQATVGSATAKKSTTVYPPTKLSEWLDGVRAIGENSESKRAVALGEISNAIGGYDDKMTLQALQAISQVGDVVLDRLPFRKKILTLLDRESGEIRKAAFCALFNVGLEEGDLAKLQKELDKPHDEGFAHVAAQLLHLFRNDVAPPESEKIIAKLLASEDSGIRREALRALWGADVSDDLADRLIELADDRESRHDAVYCLSTLPHKNWMVVDELIERLAYPDPNDWGRALRGLGYGVAESDQPKVAKAIQQLLRAKWDQRTRDKLLSLVKRYRRAEQSATANASVDAAVSELPILEQLLDEQLGKKKQLPAWLSGATNSLKIAKGQALSPLALVQQPAMSQFGEWISWTRETRTHRGGVTDISFSPDGIYSATGGEDGTVRIWKDGKTYRIIVCPGAKDEVVSVAWSGNGKLLAAASDKSISIWNMESMEKGPRFESQLMRKANVLAWSDEVLAFSDNDGVHLWANGTLIPNSGMTGGISASPWSRDGMFLLCREKNVIRVWDTVNGKVHATIGSDSVAQAGSKTSSYNTSPVFDSELGYFAFAVNHYSQQGEDQGERHNYSELLIYDINAVRVKSIRLKERPRAIAWNPGGNGLTCVGNKSVYSINLEANETSALTLERNFPVSTSRSTRCVWSAGDEQRLYVVDWGNVWQRLDEEWKWFTGSPVELQTSIAGTRIAIQSFHEGKRNALGYLPSTLEVWDKTSLNKLLSLPSKGATKFELAPNGKTLGVVTQQGSVELFDVDSGGKLAETVLGGRVHLLRFVPSGDKLYVVTSDGRVILDGRTGKILRREDSAYRLANKNWWAPDGKSYVREAKPNLLDPVAAVIVSGNNFESERELHFVEPPPSRTTEVLEEIKALGKQGKSLAESIAQQKDAISQVTQVEDLQQVLTSDEKRLPEEFAKMSEITADIDQNDFEVADLEDEKDGLEGVVEGVEKQSGFRPGRSQIESEFRKLPVAKKLRVDLAAARKGLTYIEVLEKTGRGSTAYIAQQEKVSAMLAKLRGLKKQTMGEVLVALRDMNGKMEARLTTVSNELEEKQRLARKLDEQYSEVKTRALKTSQGDKRVGLDFQLFELSRNASSLRRITERIQRLETKRRQLGSRGSRRGGRNVFSGAPAWSPDGRFILMTSSGLKRTDHNLYAWDLSNDTSVAAWKLSIQSSDYLIHFAADSKHAALIDRGTIVFVDIDKRELITQSIDGSARGVDWIGNSLYLASSDNGFVFVSPTDGVVNSIQCDDPPMIVGDRIYSNVANTLQVRDAELRLESSFILDRIDGQNSLLEVSSDGTVRSSDAAMSLPIVGLNAEYQFEISDNGN